MAIVISLSDFCGGTFKDNALFRDHFRESSPAYFAGNKLGQLRVVMVVKKVPLTLANLRRQPVDAPHCRAHEPLLLIHNEAVLPLAVAISRRGNTTFCFVAHFGSPKCVLKNVAVFAHKRSITTGSDVYMCVTPGSGSDSKSRPARNSAFESFSVWR